MTTPTRKFRRSPRRRLNTAVSLWKNRTPEQVQAKDISATGVFIETAEFIRPGSFLTLTLNLPAQPRFTALCKVVRANNGRGFGVGLEFVDVKRKDRERIVEFVDGALAHASMA